MPIAYHLPHVMFQHYCLTPFSHSSKHLVLKCQKGQIMILRSARSGLEIRPVFDNLRF